MYILYVLLSHKWLQTSCGVWNQSYLKQRCYLCVKSNLTTHSGQIIHWLSFYFSCVFDIRQHYAAHTVKFIWLLLFGILISLLHTHHGLLNCTHWTSLYLSITKMNDYKSLLLSEGCRFDHFLWSSHLNITRHFTFHGLLSWGSHREWYQMNHEGLGQQ